MDCESFNSDKYGFRCIDLALGKCPYSREVFENNLPSMDSDTMSTLQSEYPEYAPLMERDMRSYLTRDMLRIDQNQYLNLVNKSNKIDGGLADLGYYKVYIKRLSGLDGGTQTIFEYRTTYRGRFISNPRIYLLNPLKVNDFVCSTKAIELKSLLFRYEEGENL